MEAASQGWTSDQRLLLTDFETASRGPMAWDLAYMEDLVEGFPEADGELLRLCRRLVALGVTVACWAGRADHPELGWHAEHHLARLKEVAR